MTKIARIMIMMTLVSRLVDKVDDTMRFSKMVMDQDDLQQDQDDKADKDEDEDLGVRAELVDKVVSVARHIVFQVPMEAVLHNNLRCIDHNLKSNT